MRIRSVSSIILALAVGPLALVRAQEPESAPQTVGEKYAMQVFAREGNAFAFDLYGHLSRAEGNVFFSPASVRTALAMAYLGARGETASQMTKTLRFVQRADTLPDSYLQYVNALNTIPRGREGPAYELVLANAIWAQEGFPFRREFVNRLKEQFGAQARVVDYLHGDGARSEINKWVDETTKGKIKDLIPPGGVDEWTRLVLTDAIYFKGDWSEKFSPEATRDEVFHPLPQSSLQVSMMHASRKLNYAQSDTVQMVEIPYVKDDLSMIVLLPRAPFTLDSLGTAIGSPLLERFQQEKKPVLVDLGLPKFKFEREAELSPALKSMGMVDAFSGKADFSGMSNIAQLAISKVFHKAFVAVDEEGTEAAAATGGVVGVTSVRPPEERVVFQADHPFLFVIRHNRTGSILFMGRMANPKA